MAITSNGVRSGQFTGEELRVKFRWGFRLTPAKVLKIMVGPCGLEPQTSTVSKRRDYVLTTTYNALRTALVPASTAKTESLQVKLQVKNIRSDAKQVP